MLSRAPRGIRVRNGTSYAKIERATSRVRRVLLPRASVTSAIPGVELFERLDNYRVRVSGKLVGLCHDVRALSPGVEACTLYHRAHDRIHLTLSERTYHRLERGHPRARFTLGHEIGHAVLHGVELLQQELLHLRQHALARGGPVHPHYLDSEWQADAAASALLMPAEGLEELGRGRALSSKLIADVYGVSIEAATYRLQIFQQRRHELVVASRNA